MTSKYSNKSLQILLSLFLISAFTACNSDSKKNENLQYFQEHGEIFTTGYSIKYEYSRSLSEEIKSELDRFDLSLNPFKDNSIITKVNNNEEVELDSFFIKVFYKSMEISQNTNGYFDITVSPLINAWGFGFQNMDNVTPEIIDSLEEFVGYEKIKIENGKVVKADPRVELNTSAIAKGYSCDVVADLLESFGIENYMVEIGGEISAKGVNEKNNCWRIGVDKPNDFILVQHELQTVLSLCDKSLATSGNYRNFYVKDGKKYTHTIDPHTGYPSETDILSATVIADDCMTADAYATAFMAMGIDKSIEVAKIVPGLHYYFIYDNETDGSFAVKHSEGFEQFFANNR
ncbi:FAD:protein FMN transferase [Lascolabacillus massiliensis]|uniref:FAD:protein FMN transferase n=1 Tax=Lascolabacillus massiliensis TaxID=1627894 RepID=UPI0006B3394D|nr:FAD:protein FMN transferase [Lascolabacillus massiliensis]